MFFCFPGGGTARWSASGKCASCGEGAPPGRERAAAGQSERSHRGQDKQSHYGAKAKCRSWRTAQGLLLWQCVRRGVLPGAYHSDRCFLVQRRNGGWYWLNSKNKTEANRANESAFYLWNGQLVLVAGQWPWRAQTNWLSVDLIREMIHDGSKIKMNQFLFSSFSDHSFIHLLYLRMVYHHWPIVKQSAVNFREPISRTMGNI